MSGVSDLSFGKTMNGLQNFSWSGTLTGDKIVTNEIDILQEGTCPTPTAGNQIANKDYVDNAIPVVTGFLKVDGSNSMLADINIGSNKIKNVSNGTSSSDGVNLGQLTAVITDVNTNTAAIATNASNISSNTSAITTANTNIATNTSAITTANTNIATNTSAITTANSNIATNASNISSNTSAITTANTNIATNTSAITTANTNIATNTSAIATNASAISTIQGDYFKKDGSVSATGDFNLNSNKITSLAAPTADTDASTKKYVDDNAGSLWTELSGNIYYDVGGSNVGVGLTAPAYALEVKGSMRVAQGQLYDAGFLAESTTGNIRTFNNYNQTGDTNAAIVCRQMTDFSATKYTELEIQQIYRNTSQNNSAVWGINVRSENGSFVGNQTNSAILCLMKDNGSVVVNSSRNNNGVRLRVHGTAAGSSGYAIISDDRIKYHETDITNALGTINKLKAQKYQKIVESLDDTGKWIPSDAEWDTVKNEVNAKGQRLYEYIEEIGFIAQDVRNKIPELSFCVTGEEEDEAGDQTPLMVSYNDIFCLAIQGIQELSQRVTTLESEIKEMKS